MARRMQSLSSSTRILALDFCALSYSGGKAMLLGKPTLLGRAASTLAVVAIGLVVQPAWTQDVQPGVELQTRGPIHEAFAEAIGTAPAIGLVVPKQPPEPVNEIPPDVKPEGDVVWIPGYWAWDDERNDFLWVSGVWRVPP